MLWTALAILLLLSIPGASLLIAHRNLRRRNLRQRALAGELEKLEHYLRRQRQIDRIKDQSVDRDLDRESHAFLEACYSLISEDDSSRR